MQGHASQGTPGNMEILEQGTILASPGRSQGKSPTGSQGQSGKILCFFPDLLQSRALKS